MENFNGLATLGKGLLANIFGSGDSIAQNIMPYVDNIQGKNNNGDYQEIESLGAIDGEGPIRVAFTNDAIRLNADARAAVEEQMEKTIDFSPKVMRNSIIMSNSDEENYKTFTDTVVLFQGTYEGGLGVNKFSSDTVFHQLDQQFSAELVGGEFERQYFYVDLKPKNPLPRSDTKYKMLIKRSIINAEGQTLKESFVLTTGFSINPATVLSGSLI